MHPDDDELKKGLKKSMSEPAKKSDWLKTRRQDHEKPHGNDSQDAWEKFNRERPQNGE